MFELFFAFNQYVEGYLEEERASLHILKFFHSYRVAHQCHALARSLRLSGPSLDQATALGLLHDLGRFEQLKRYGTYQDLPGQDHGEVGAEVLDQVQSIKNLLGESIEIFKQVTRFHGLKDLPKGLKEPVPLYLNLIRDADKLDILSIVKDYVETGRLQEIWEHIGPSFGVSRQVRDSYLSQDPIDKVDIRTNGDVCVLLLSFFYSLSFNASKSYFIRENHLGWISNKLESKEVLAFAKKLQGEVPWEN